MESHFGPSVLLFGAAGAIGTEVVRLCRESAIQVTPVFHRDAPVSAEGSLCANIADRAAVDATCRVALDKGKITSVVNCCGVSFFAPLTGDFQFEWETMYRVNTLGLANLLSVVAARLPGVEHFVHLNSLAAHRLPSHEASAVYASSKAACTMLLAQFRRSQRIRGFATKVTSISPGFVRSSRFAERYFKLSPAQRTELYDRFEPLEATDVAEVVLAVLRLSARIEVSEIIVRPRRQPD